MRRRLRDARREHGPRLDPIWTRRIPNRYVRSWELRRSCRALGAERPRFLGFEDGTLDRIEAPIEQVGALIREVRPDVLLTLGPDGAYGHTDHLAVHRWVTEAWAALPEPRPALLYAAFPRGVMRPQHEACEGSPILGQPPAVTREDLGVDEPHYTLPIEAVQVRKLRAIAAHRSQLSRGDPYALFPAGVIVKLLTEEWLTDARGARDEATAALLGELTARRS